MTNYPVIVKNWGTSQQIFAFGSVEMHRIVAAPGGFCSIHRHLRKNNLFVVERGQLHVLTGRVLGDDFLLDRQHVLREGDQVDVPAGVWHQFQTPMGAIGLEVYWVDAGGEDIERRSVGGVRV